VDSQSLKSKTARGMVWNAIDKFAVQGSQFIIGIILARLLLPTDYGLIGMLAIFIAVSQLFVDSGFTKALVQKKDKTDSDFSTVFYFNLGLSFIIYIILFLTAPFIAGFYEVPELVPLTRVLAISIIINAFTIVQNAKFTIELDFKTMAKVNFVSVIISGAIGVGLAYYGYGVWSLVYQTLIRGAIVTIMFWLFSKWRPSLIFSILSFKQLFRFGSKLLGAGVIGTIFQNIYFIIIGKIFSAKELGYYTRGFQFAEITSGTVTSVIQNVSFPLLASIQDDKIQLAAVYRRLIRLTTFIIFPAMILFALHAEPFVRFFLTEKWMPAVPLLQWLCFARIFTPISALNMNILNAIGRSDLYLKLDISKIPLILIALFITIPYGVKAVVIGHFVISFICFFINAYYPGKLFGYGALKQIREMGRVILCTIIMTVCVFVVMFVLNSDILKITICAPLGVGVFLLMAYLLKMQEFTEVRKMAKLVFNKIIRNDNKGIDKI